MNKVGSLRTNTSEFEPIPRSYGNLFLLSPRSSGFENLQVLLMVISAGSKTSKHYHPSEEVFYVLRGNAMFKGKDEEFEIRSEDVILVLPNEPHQIENLSSIDTCEILIVLSPPRKAEEVVYCD